MAWYSEFARQILPRPTPTPAGDKPPRYIFSFRHRPSVYNSARFAGGEPASRLIGGHIFVPMTLTKPAPISLDNYWAASRSGVPVAGWYTFLPMSSEAASDLLRGLNSDQRRAVVSTSGPILVLAGPGSGKTRLIVHRIAYLIREAGVAPEEILALTFTNRAALELRERLAGAIPAAARRITAGTFHSICARWLRSDGGEIGVSPSFSIYDTDQQARLIKEALAELNIDNKRVPPSSVQSRISSAKNRHAGGRIEMPRGALGLPGQMAQSVFDRYEKKLSERKSLDFDDLLLRVIELFLAHPQIRDRYSSRYRHQLVDEFQDTNTIQYRLLKLLRPKGGSVCVVGDEDQSIYSWRHADLANIINFPTDYSQAETMTLGQNYRSTQNIIDAAASLIKANSQRHDKRLWTDNPPGEALALVECSSDDEEAHTVASHVRRFRNRGMAFNEMAVLYRTNAQSRVLETAFARLGIPARVIGVRFFRRAEVQDVLAYLYAAFNPYDDAHLLRIINVPTRGAGAKTIAGLRDYALGRSLSLSHALDRLFGSNGGEDEPDLQVGRRGVAALQTFHKILTGLRAKIEQVTPTEILDAAIKDTGYASYVSELPDSEDRMSNLDQLRGAATGYEGAGFEPISDFLQQVALVSDADAYSHNADLVTLATFHGAKGLEFDAVFLTGLEEGLCPHSRSVDNPSAMEEERRLVYVGMTRARKHLVLSYAESRWAGVGTMMSGPSRFLKDLPGDLQAIYPRELAAGVRPKPAPPPISTAAGRPAPQVLAPFRPADRVRHGKFGVGVIISCKRAGEDYVVEVVFDGVGPKKLMQSFANLEKV